MRYERQQLIEAAARTGYARPALTRIANAAGCSTSTVKHVLNGAPPVSPEVRRRVLQVIGVREPRS